MGAEQLAEEEWGAGNRSRPGHCLPYMVCTVDMSAANDLTVTRSRALVVCAVEWSRGLRNGADSARAYGALFRGLITWARFRH